MEHAFELLRELVATLDFELREHAAFSVIRHRSTSEKSLCEMGLVIPFKSVLFYQVAEDSDCLV